MNFNDMLTTLRAIQDKIQAKYSLLDHKTFILARSTKMTEELGEFADEILSSLGLQRQDKLDKYDKSKLESEFADAYVTLLLLGLACDIDVEKVIEKRIKEQAVKWLR